MLGDLERSAGLSSEWLFFLEARVHFKCHTNCTAAYVRFKQVQAGKQELGISLIGLCIRINMYNAFLPKATQVGSSRKELNKTYLDSGISNHGAYRA